MVEMTIRQREALLLLAQGWTVKRIGRKFGIGPSSTKYHLRRAYQALGAVNGPHAVALGVEAGLIPLRYEPATLEIRLALTPQRCAARKGQLHLHSEGHELRRQMCVAYRALGADGRANAILRCYEIGLFVRGGQR